MARWKDPSTTRKQSGPFRGIAVQDPRSVVWNATMCVQGKVRIPRLASLARDEISFLIERQRARDELQLVLEELGQPDRLPIRGRVLDEQDSLPYVGDDVAFLTDVRLRRRWGGARHVALR